MIENTRGFGHLTRSLFSIEEEPRDRIKSSEHCEFREFKELQTPEIVGITGSVAARFE